MIDRLEFCIDHLESLHRTGGEARMKSNKSTDPNRPLIYIELTNNSSYYDMGILQGKVVGLQVSYGGTILDNDCIEYGCLEETGVWTTAIKTDISRLNGATTEYWVRGPLDGVGNAYVVDLGYIYLTCYETAIREEHVPLKEDSSFSSKYPIPLGIKFVRLRKVGSTSATDILHHMGKYQVPDNLSRSETGYLLEYNYSDQKVDLEELSFSLICALISTYYRPSSKRYIFRDLGYVDPSITLSISDNLARLSRLVDVDPESKRFGSVPRYPATYSEPSQIYGDAADLSYEQTDILLIEEGCLEDDCLSSYTNQTLISREVNTRAIAWLLYSYSIHLLAYSSPTYISTIAYLGTYLIEQINPELSLLSEGWTHNPIYANSVRIDEHRTSTSIASFMAMMKAYDATREQLYLDKSADICDAVLSLLYDRKFGNFIHGYEDSKASIEANVYGLLLAWTIGRSDIIERLIRLFYSRIRNPDEFFTLTPVIDTNGNPVLNSEGEQIYVSGPILIDPNNPISMSFIKEMYAGETYPVSDILRFNTILYNIMEAAEGAGYDIPYISWIRELRSRLATYQASNRDFMSISYVSECTLNKSIWSYEFAILSGPEDLASLKFYRNFLYERLRKTWPLNFTWVSDLARSPKGVLGSILRGVAKASANLFTQSRRIEDSSYLEIANNQYLNDWGDDLSLTRWVKEEDSHYRSRLRHNMIGGSNTAPSITSCLKYMDFNTSAIKDTWRDILVFNSEEESCGNPILGDGYLSGTSYANTNIFLLEASQIIGNDIVSEVERIRSAGTIPLYQETLLFSLDKDNSNRTCIYNSYVNEGAIPYIIIDIGDPLNLLHEDTNLMLSEGGDELVTETGNIIDDNSHLLQGLDGFIPL